MGLGPRDGIGQWLARTSAVGREKYRAFVRMPQIEMTPKVLLLNSAEVSKCGSLPTTGFESIRVPARCSTAPLSIFSFRDFSF